MMTTMNMQTTQARTQNRNWWMGWMIAFLGFPPGGLLATLLIGKLETPIEGLIGGAVAGAVIGGAQYLALRRRLPIGVEWIVVVSASMGAGVALSTALFGTDTTLEAILLRAPVTGFLVGIGQWLLLRRHVGGAFWLVVATPILFVIAWFVTAQVIRTSVNEGFVIFGASGALVYQALSGLILGVLMGRKT